MKKPLHPFARVIWALLTAYVLIDVIFWFEGQQHSALLPQDLLLQLAQGTIYAIVLFGSAATLIELVDRMRWNALRPERQLENVRDEGR